MTSKSSNGGRYQARRVRVAARHQAIAAQALPLETDLQLKQAALADATGLPAARLAPMFPSNAAIAAEAQASMHGRRNRT